MQVFLLVVIALLLRCSRKITVARGEVLSET